jgi:hypothetical protein
MGSASIRYAEEVDDDDGCRFWHQSLVVTCSSIPSLFLLVYFDRFLLLVVMLSILHLHLFIHRHMEQDTTLQLNIFAHSH